MTNVAMDGIIFELQIRGGISRVYHEILPRICEMDSSIRVDLYTGSRLRQEPPSHEQIQCHTVWAPQRLLKPERVWQNVRNEVRRFFMDRAIGSGKGRIWHSTYYTLPHHWDGATVVTVHDVLCEDLKEFFPRASMNNIEHSRGARCNKLI